MRLILLGSMLCLTTTLFARLGENEAQLIQRFGEPRLRTSHSVFAQGKSWVLGPQLHFRQDDWSITAVLVDARCGHIHYTKVGEWTDEQFLAVLNANSQGGRWTETSKPGGIPKLQRSWRRDDGATTRWQLGVGLTLITPAYNRAKAVAEAKAAASRSPKI